MLSQDLWCKRPNKVLKHTVHKNIKFSILIEILWSTKLAYYNDFWRNRWDRRLEIQICHHTNKLNIKIYTNKRQLFLIVSIFHSFYCIYNQINAALVSIRDFFQKHYINLNIAIIWLACGYYRKQIQ